MQKETSELLNLQMTRGTAALHKLAFQQLASDRSQTGTARVKFQEFYDEYAWILEQGENRVIGTDESAEALKSILIRRPTSYPAIPTEWVYTVYKLDGTQELQIITKSVYNLFRETLHHSELPPGLLLWAAESLPGAEILVKDSSGSRVIEIIIREAQL